MSDAIPKRSARVCPMLLTAIALAAAWSAPARAPAQSDGGSVSAEAAFAPSTLAGDDFQNVGLGPGGEVGVRYRFTDRLSLGLVGRGSWHETVGLDGSLRLLGVSLRPRYALATDGDGLRPFVGGRLGVSRWHGRRAADTVSADVRADGLQLGAAAGVAYPVAGGTSLELSAFADYLTFGDAELDARLGDRELPVRTPEGSGTTGVLLGLRTLVRVGLP